MVRRSKSPGMTGSTDALCRLKRKDVRDSAMLKVAIIIERAEIGLGGAERSVSELTAELRCQGVAATILAAKGTASENTVILCGDHAGKRVPLKVFESALRSHLNEHHYDIVHSTLPLAIADVYQPRGGSYREAMLQHIASYSCPCQRMLKRCTHRLNLKRTQYLDAEKKLCTQTKVTVTALSYMVKGHFQKHYGLSEGRIAVIPNGINIDMQPDANVADKLKETILKSVSIPEGKEPMLFLFAANNAHLKGIDPLMKAMRQLSEHPPISSYPVLVTAGTKEIKADTENVVSLGSLDRVCEELSVCDAVVLPTWYDPCSRFILEALAMGKPVVTTRFNGACERFIHQKHGIILERPDNIAELAAALETFCDRDKIELAHKAIVDDNLSQNISIAGHVEMLIDLYDRVMAQKEK
jgi:UDP-glucose:(heptosyl)LPS alpha-1,3-glucosyltransferase